MDRKESFWTLFIMNKQAKDPLKEDDETSTTDVLSNESAQQNPDVIPDTLEKGGDDSADHTELDETTDASVDESEDTGDATKDESPGLQKPFIRKIPVKKKLLRVRALLDGSILYAAWYKGDVHVTGIMRSITTFDVDWAQPVLDYLQGKYSTIDVKVTKDVPFDVSDTYPGSEARSVESKSFNKSLNELMTKVNGYRWTPHITFHEGEIVKKLDGMKLKVFLFKPNWNYKFDRNYVFDYLRIRKHLQGRASPLRLAKIQNSSAGESTDGAEPSDEDDEENE
jgi:hypothetical protein